MPPWEKYQDDSSGPWAKYGGEKPSQGFLAGAKDFVSSIPRGVAKGIASGVETAAALGQGAPGIAKLGMNMITGQRSEFAPVVDPVAQPVINALPAPQGTAGEYGETAGEFLGNPLTYAGPGSLAVKGALGLTSALGSEAAGQLTKGHPSIEPFARFGGAVLGGTLPAGVTGFAKGMKVPEVRSPYVDTLRAHGIEPTAGTVTGNRAVQRAESTLANQPGSGGAGERVLNRQMEQYSAAATRNVGADTPYFTPDVVQETFARYQAKMESAAQNSKIKASPKLDDAISAIEKEAFEEGANPDQINRISKLVQGVLNGFVTKGPKAPNIPAASGLNLEQALQQATHHINASTAGRGATTGIMDGRTYQSLTGYDSPLKRAIDERDPIISYYAVKLRSALDDALEATARGRGTREGTGLRQALADLKEGRRGWYNTLVLSEAAAGAGEKSAEGLITPQKLRAIIANTKDKKLQYAKGRGDFADLSRAGNALMSTLPNSNTAERSALIDLATRGLGALGGAFSGEPITGGVAGAIFGPGLAGRALMSRPVQAGLKGQLPLQAGARSINEAIPGGQALRSGVGSLQYTPDGYPYYSPPNEPPTPGGGGGGDPSEGGGGPGDTLLRPPANPAGPGALRPAASALAPNLTSIASGEAAPPPAPPPSQPGKVPGTGDPRIPGAVAEGTELGLTAATAAMPGGAALRAGRAAEALAGRLGGAGARALEHPATMAGTAVGLASQPEPAEAASLTRKQQRELEFKREQMRMESEDAAKRSAQATRDAADLTRQNRQAEADAKRQEAEDASRIATERQAEEQRLARQHETEMANRPFRERYPNLSNAMNNTGLAMAALLPYGTRIWQAAPASAFVRTWEKAALQAEEALARGDMAAAKIQVNKLGGFMKQNTELEKKAGKGASNAALYAASAALPFEFSAMPEQIDLGTGSPEAKQHAKDILLDPLRIPSALAQGATVTALGAKAPLPFRSRLPPKAQSIGAASTLRSMEKQRAAAKKPPARRAPLKPPLAPPDL